MSSKDGRNSVRPTDQRERPRGLFVGLATLDVIQGTDRLPMEDEKLRGQWQWVGAGGPATNAAVTFALLGGDATLWATFGTSPAAQVARAEVEGWGVTVIDVAEPGFSLSISSIVVPTSGKRSVVSTNQVGTWLDLPTAPTVDVVLVDGHAPVRATDHALVRHEGPVLFDGGSWKPNTGEQLEPVTHAVCSASFVPPGVPRADVLDWLARRCPTCAITNGAEPVVWRAGDDGGAIGVPTADVADTLGAGDVFHGAAALSMANGQPWPTVLAYAAQIASTSCRYRGPRRGVEESGVT